MSRLLLFLSTFYIAALFGQAPEPSELKKDWWAYFEVSGPELEMRVATVQEELRTLVQGLSEENRERAEPLLKRIDNNLQAYTKIAQQPLPTHTTPLPFAPNYTIETLIQLNQKLRKVEIDVKSLENERNDENETKVTEQERLNRLRVDYGAVPERSEEKTLLGLETIIARTSVEVATRKLQLLDQSIEVETQQIAHLQDEIQYALEHLISNQMEQARFARKITASKSLWDVSKRQLQEKETERADSLSEEPGEQIETGNQLLTLQVIEAEIKETIAHSTFIQAEMVFQISRLVNQPDEVDLDRLYSYFRQWKSEVDRFRQDMGGWREHSQRAMQRATQILSLNDQDAEHRVQLDNVIKASQNNFVLIQQLTGDLADSRFLIEIFERNVLRVGGTGELWIRKVMSLFVDTLYDLGDFLTKTRFTIGERPVSLMSILNFLIIIVVTIWFSKVTISTLNTFTRRRKGVRKSVIYRFNRLVQYLIFFFGVIIALTVLGFDLTNLLILAGALSVGIGFGLQQIFNNFLSGIIILFQSHLKIGDYIEFESGLRGEIREINFRSTVITTNDGIEVLIPNSEMVNKRVINWTLKDPYRRVKIPFGVAYESDIDNVAKIVIEAANQVPSTLKMIGGREPVVYLKNFGDSALEFELVVWVTEKYTRRVSKTRSEYLWAIEHALKKHGIVVPFPQRDVHLIEPGK